MKEDPTWVPIEDAARLYPYIDWPEPVEGQTHWALHAPFSDQAAEETDLALITGVERAFGSLTIDLAATDFDHKAPRWLTPERDTFTVDWATEIGDGIGWLNPPPLKNGMMRWFQKCAEEAQRGARFLLITNAALDSYEFWEYLLPHATIYVLYPRMAYQGTPMPMVVAAFNIRHLGWDGSEQQLRLWNWMTGLIR